MKFSKKLFISLLATSLLVGSAVIWVAHSYVSSQVRERFIGRYSVFSKILGDTLSRLDSNTETMMHNAAKVVAARDGQKGLLSTKELMSLRDDLKVTHIFVTDKKGKFIRSTNEDPSLIPNLFSFCSDYRNLISGTSNVEATPIIKPDPEPKPYKFLSIPTPNRKRIIEVGVRVDFIAKTLAEAIGSDQNVVAMSLYAPNGTPFGRFGSESVEFPNKRAKFMAELGGYEEDRDQFRFFSKVRSSHPSCCQCDQAGISKDGEYYYVLKSEISKGELTAIQATTRNAFVLLLLGNLFLSFLIARYLARRLGRNIEEAANKVRAIKEKGNFSDRIGLTGDDEVGYLTQEFDHLLDGLEESKRKIVEAEKVQAKVEVARDVAHNMNSPVRALQMTLPQLVTIPEGLKKVLADSVREIKALSGRMGRLSESLKGKATAPVVNILKPTNLPSIIESVVKEKRIEYSSRKDLSFISECWDAKICAELDPVELKAILSNLINNSVEAMRTKGGVIELGCRATEDGVELWVDDNGKGMSGETLKNWDNGIAYTEKENGNGIGLTHLKRTVKAWDGGVTIEVNPGLGTRISINLNAMASVYPGLSLNRRGCGTKKTQRVIK